MLNNQQIETFLNIFSSTVDKIAPYKKAMQKEIRLRKNPWLAYGILKLSNQKIKCFLPCIKISRKGNKLNKETI